MVRHEPYAKLTGYSINMPMVAEARDFHCHFHVTDNLGERSPPSDHVATRVVTQKTVGLLRHCPAHPQLDVQTSRSLHEMKRISDDHQDLDEPLAAPAEGRSSTRPRNGLVMSFFAAHRADGVLSF